MPVPVDGAFLELVQKRGYSMLHLISDEEYAAKRSDVLGRL